MSQLLFNCRYTYPSGFHLAARFEAGPDVTALFGPSGSGKTTILSLLAGILKPQDGRICIADRVVFDSQQRIWMPPEQRRLAVVFQDHLLFPHMTVGDNLRYGNKRRPARTLDFARVVDMLEIGSFLDRLPETLSGGQRQRVALGRALLRGPEVLLLDEPVTALDQDLKDRILTYVERALAEWRVPTILVSHEQAVVRRLAKQVVILDAGRVVAEGPMNSTLDRALLTQPRPGSGPVNLLKVSQLRRSDEYWVGLVGMQELRLPAVQDVGKGDTLFVEFLSRDVLLGTEPVTGLSVRNQLHGEVKDIVILKETVFAAIEVGQLLWAEITPEAARELNLHVGQAVTCLIKTSALNVLR